MLWALRHVVAIAVLPFTMAVLIPTWLARRNGVTLALGASPAEMALQASASCCWDWVWCCSSPA